MAEHDVTVKIGGDASGVSEAFKKAGDALEEFQHGLHAIEGAVGFEKITEIFTEITGAAARAEMAQRKFEGTLRASGEAADPEKFYGLAEALEKTTTFSKTATVEAASMLSRFKLGQGEISSLIPHIQDLSAAMGMDMAGASDAMGRAVATGAEGLRALGLGFTTAEKAAFQMGTQQQRVQMLIEKTAVFQGSAAAMAQTAAGAHKQYQNAVEALTETLGKIIDKPFAQWFSRQTEAVRGLTEWFQNLSGPSRDALAAIGSGLLIVGGAAAGLVALTSAVSLLGGMFATAASGAAMLFGAASSVLLPLAAIAAAAFTLKLAWDTNFEIMGASLQTWLERVKRVFAGLMEAFNKVGDAMIWLMGKATGLSDKEIDLTIKESHKGGGLLNLDDAKKTASEWGEAAKTEAQSIGKDLVEWGGKAGKELAKFLKDNLGIDIAGLGGRGHEAKKIAGGGGPGVSIGLKDLFAGKPLGMSQDFGLKAGSSLAGAMGGGDAGTQRASEFLRSVQRTTGMSEAGLEQLAEAMAKSGKTGDQIWEGLTQFAMDANHMQAATTQALMNQAKAAGKGISWTDLLSTTLQASATGGADWSVLVQKAMPIIAGLKGAAEQIGENLLGAGGALGNTISQAMKAGDPMSAGAAVITGFLEQSQSFQNLVAQLNQIFTKLAQALNPLIDGLGPIVDAIASVAQVLGTALAGIFRAIQPIFGIIDAVVRPVLSVIGSLIGAVFKPLTAVFKLLMQPLKLILPIIKTIGELFQAFAPIIFQLQASMMPVELVLNLLKPAFEALHKAFTYVGVTVLKFAMMIGNIWNTILNGIAGIVDKIANALPSWLGGDALKDFAKSIRGATIDMHQMQDTIDQLNSTTQETDGQFTQLQAPLASINQTLNAPEGFAVNLDRFMSIQRGLGDTASNADTTMQGPGAVTTPVAPPSAPPPPPAPPPATVDTAQVAQVLAFAKRFAQGNADNATKEASQTVNVQSVVVQGITNMKDIIAQVQAAADKSRYVAGSTTSYGATSRFVMGK